MFCPFITLWPVSDLAETPWEVHVVTRDSWLIASRRAVVDTGSVAAVLVTVLVVCALVSGVVASLPAVQQKSLRAAMGELRVDDSVVEVVSSYDAEETAQHDRAVRQALAPLVAPAGGVVLRQTETVSYQQASGQGSWSFSAVSGSDDLVRAVEGRLPDRSAGAAVEVAVRADDVERPQVGDRLTLTSPLDGSRVRALVVGSWRPGTDGLRALGEPSKPSLLVSDSTFEQLAARASSVTWRATPSFHLLEPEQLDETLSAASGTERAVAAAAESEGASMRVENPLVEVLQARGRELMAQRMLLLVPALVLLLLGAAAAALVAGALSQTRRGDEWLRRSRGAGRLQVVGPTVLEATVLCALGALGGPVVAAALVRIGGVRPALDASAWTAGAVAALICWTALVAPALAWAMTGDRGEPLSAERRRRRVLTSLLVGVLLMLALGVVAVMRLQGFSSAVADTTRWSGQVDPLVVASPALLLLALVTVLALVLLPMLFRLAERTDRMRGAVLALGTRSASRAPGRAVPLALAVALVAGGVAFASVGHASQEHARHARAAYEVGADVRVTVPPASRRAGGVAERRALEGLPGVQDAAAVHRELDFVDDVAVEVLVVELDGRAGQAIAGTTEDPSGLLGRLESATVTGSEGVPVAVTQDLAEQASLKTGDRFELTVGAFSTPLRIAQIVTDLPTLSSDRAGVLVSQDLVSRNLAETPGPDEWWLAVDDSALDGVASQLAQRPDLAGSVLTRAKALRRLETNPGSGGAALTDVMRVTAVGSLLIGAVLLCSVVVLRRREREEQAGFLRALGADDRDVTLTLVTEYTVTTGSGIVAGALAGVVTAAVALHATSLGSGGQPLAPAPELQVDWAWLLSLLAVLLLVPLAALYALTNLGARRGGRSSIDGRRRP